MEHDSIPPVTKLFNRVTQSMRVGREGICLEEWEAVNDFWPSLTALLKDKTGDAILLPLFEEALVLRILSHRLLRELETNAEPEDRKVDFKEGVKSWLTTQERLRIIMKEILKRYGHTDSPSEHPVSLAQIMAPILKQGEGILDDALEFEARKKSAQKKTHGTRKRPGVASTS